MFCADQRYYASAYGRFNTADQYMASAGPKDPGTWNRYSYTAGDPVNRIDPSGMNFLVTDCTFGGCGSDGGWGEDGGPTYDSGGEGVAGICFTNPAWAAEHATACGITVAYTPPQQQQPPPQPTCSISLYERPVGVPIVGLLADHTYLLVQDASGSTETIEGGPDLVSVPLGYLVGTVSTPPETVWPELTQPFPAINRSVPLIRDRWLAAMPKRLS